MASEIVSAGEICVICIGGRCNVALHVDATLRLASTVSCVSMRRNVASHPDVALRRGATQFFYRLLGG